MAVLLDSLPVPVAVAESEDVGGLPPGVPEGGIVTVTATAHQLTQPVTDRPLIRPPDPKFGADTGVRLGRYSSAEAVRILLHGLFRGAHTAIDLTYGAGRFWKAPYPPGLALATNNIDPNAPTDLHADFTATGPRRRSWRGGTAPSAPPRASRP